MASAFQCAQNSSELRREDVDATPAGTFVSRARLGGDGELRKQFRVSLSLSRGSRAGGACVLRIPGDGFAHSAARARWTGRHGPWSRPADGYSRGLVLDD